MAEEPANSLVASLETTARAIRRDTVRTLYAAGSGHPGGGLSVADLLTALYFRELRLDPAHPDGPDRDRLVVSDDAAAPALYAALAERGVLPREALLSVRGHSGPARSPVDRNPLPTIEAGTGELGPGVGVAIGMALDARLSGRENRVYALVGDRECQGGSTWEAFLAAGHFRLANFVAIVARNRPETAGRAGSALGIEPVAEKLRAFGFRTLEIDGHSFPEILDAFAEARKFADGPTAIVARTVSGKGVPFLEGQPARHAAALSRSEVERALRELGSSLEAPFP